MIKINSRMDHNHFKVLTFLNNESKKNKIKCLLHKLDQHDMNNFFFSNKEEFFKKTINSAK